MHSLLATRLSPLAIAVLCACNANPTTTSLPPATSTSTSTTSLPPAPLVPSVASTPLSSDGIIGDEKRKGDDRAEARSAIEQQRVALATKPVDNSTLGAGKVGTSGHGAGNNGTPPDLNAVLGGLKGATVGGADGAGGLGLRGVGAGGGGAGLATSGLMVTRGSAGRGASGAMGYASSGTGVGYGSGSGSGVAQLRIATPRIVNENVELDTTPHEGGKFVHAGVNPIVDTREDRFSTFAIDVDSGSWLYAKRFLKQGRPPTPASVRVEEFVNAMHYDYAGPKDAAFAVHVDAAPSPFTRDMDVVRVAIQGKRMTQAERKKAHVTFLVDVSGSMASPDKLPWAKRGIDIAVDNLRDDDTVAIVTYAGETRLVLPATSVRERATIHTAVETLASGGGTNMDSGMQLAYREATKELGSDRTSRVIVLSDGDANIGRVSHDDILHDIRGYVSEGVTMSTMGFGSGNYNDHLMEQLADAGNGNYTYIDSQESLRRFFADEMTQTLEVIAQDAKIQVEWNADVVRSYRLLGYENRDIADKDFRNDKKDAGEIGAGHAVTALYEIARVDPKAPPTSALGTVRIRHKVPRHEHATEIAVAIAPAKLAASVDALDDDAKAALGMALAAEIMRGSEHAAGLTLVDAAKLLRSSAHGAHAAERSEAAQLFEKAPAAPVPSN